MLSQSLRRPATRNRLPFGCRPPDRMAAAHGSHPVLTRPGDRAPKKVMYARKKSPSCGTGAERGSLPGHRVVERDRRSAAAGERLQRYDLFNLPDGIGHSEPAACGKPSTARTRAVARLRYLSLRSTFASVLAGPGGGAG